MRRWSRRRRMGCRSTCWCATSITTRRCASIIAKACVTRGSNAWRARRTGLPTFSLRAAERARMAASEPALCLSLHQARLLHPAAQGLLLAPRRRARQADVLAAIECMRPLQIDTIHVVARSPYLVLYSRLGAYRAAWLDELLAEAVIFECWGHEACFAPIADYPLHRRHMLEGSRHWAIRRARRFAASHRADIDA